MTPARTRFNGARMAIQSNRQAEPEDPPPGWDWRFVGAVLALAALVLTPLVLVLTVKLPSNRIVSDGRVVELRSEPVSPKQETSLSSTLREFVGHCAASQPAEVEKEAEPNTPKSRRLQRRLKRPAPAELSNECECVHQVATVAEAAKTPLTISELRARAERCIADRPPQPKDTPIVPPVRPEPIVVDVTTSATPWSRGYPRTSETASQRATRRLQRKLEPALTLQQAKLLTAGDSFAWCQVALAEYAQVHLLEATNALQTAFEHGVNAYPAIVESLEEVGMKGEPSSAATRLVLRRLRQRYSQQPPKQLPAVIFKTGKAVGPVLSFVLPGRDSLPEDYFETARRLTRYGAAVVVPASFPDGRGSGSWDGAELFNAISALRQSRLLSGAESVLLVGQEQGANLALVLSQQAANGENVLAISPLPMEPPEVTESDNARLVELVAAGGHVYAVPAWTEANRSAVSFTFDGDALQWLASHWKQVFDRL